MPVDETRVLVITNGSRANRADAVKNRKLVDVMRHFYSDITLISFASLDAARDAPDIRMISMNDEIPGIARVMYTQIALSLKVLGSRSTGPPIDTIIFAFGMDLQLLPIVTSKIVARRIIIRSDGRPSLVYERYLPRHTRLARTLFRLLEEVNYRLADNVLTECQYMVNDNDFDKYHAGVGSLFIDTSHFAPNTPIPTRKFDVGYVGRLSATKGTPEFLEALERLPKRLKAVIVGEGDLSERVTEMMRDSQKFSNSEGASIEYLAWVSHDRLPETLNQIRLLVIPSAKEGLPNILVEAMACGTPVLATSVGGIPGVLRHNETGFLLIDNSPKSIAEGITSAMDNRQLLERVSSNARNFIMREFSLKRSIEHWRRAF